MCILLSLSRVSLPDKGGDQMGPYVVVMSFSLSLRETFSLMTFSVSSLSPRGWDISAGPHHRETERHLLLLQCGLGGLACCICVCLPLGKETPRTKAAPIYCL